MTGRAGDAAAAKLTAGLRQIEPLLREHGFRQAESEQGKGSGGPFATATFVRDDRELHLWLRLESLNVRYRVGETTLDHAGFMRELLGPGGPSRFPPYAEDSEAAFVALRHDLERFCADFLSGDGDEFRRCAASTDYGDTLSGTQRLARIEQQLKRE